MKNFVIGISVAAVMLIAGVVVADYTDWNPRRSANLTRSCILPAGGWTTIDCSAAAAYSAELNAPSSYLIQSTAATVYFALDDASSGADADANDGYLDAGDIVRIATTDTSKWVTCLGTANAGKILYIECQ